MINAWNGFEGGLWQSEINVRDFIQRNYTAYDGDKSFLAGPTDATQKLWDELQSLQAEERRHGGVLDMDTDIVSTITSHKPGYINERLSLPAVWLQAQRRPPQDFYRIPQDP